MKSHQLFRIGIALALVSPLVLAASDLALLPLPLKVEPQDGRFVMTSNTVVCGASPEAQTLAIALRQASGFPLPVVTNAGEAAIQLRMDPSLRDTLGAEGYRCCVRETSVEISAATDAGLFYGGITFRQLLPGAAFGTNPSRTVISWSAPCVAITDRPEFEWRGMMIDVARHYFPPETLKKWVDVLAAHKLNRMHLHLTDDQGWRVAIQRFPLLVDVGALRAESPKPGDRAHGDGVPYGPFFYTQDQLRDLVAYAQARHVMIIPEIDLPGHCVSALAAYPQFSCRGAPLKVSTEWKRRPDVLCLGNDEVVAFAEAVLGEVADIFPAPFIHVGGDEVILDRWKECPKCQARMKALGLQDEAQLHAWFNHKLESDLAAHHRRMIGWDEILEGDPSASTAIMCWRDSDAITSAAQAGHEVVASPSAFCYFDTAQSRQPGEPESSGRFLPLSKAYSWNPVPDNLPEGLRARVLGGEAALWSEYLFKPENVEYAAFPRACALAEVTWTRADARNEADFMRRLAVQLERLKQMRVNYRPVD